MGLRSVCFFSGVLLVLLALTAFAHASAVSELSLQIPDQNKNCHANLNDFLDLRQFTAGSDLNNNMTDPDRNSNTNLIDTNHINYSIVSQSNTSAANCFIDKNYFVSCSAQACTNGYSNISLSATDKLGHVASDNFKLTLSGQSNIPSAPFLQIPAQDLSCKANLNDFLDLRQYTLDGNLRDISYSITAQSNTGVANCFIDKNYFVSCTPKECSSDFTNISISATDKFGQVGHDYFKLTLEQFAPVWRDIQSVCINQSTANLIDLKQYASDIEDKNNLTFTLGQSTSPGIDCFLSGGHYVSCNLSTNRQLTDNLNIGATDSNGLTTYTNVAVSSNCFDKNGNDTNYLGTGIVFEAENKGICLEKCTSYSTQVKVQNVSQDRKCFTFDAASYPNTLPVSVSPSDICVDPNQATYITLSANTCGAEQRPYTVRLFAQDSNMELLFDFSIGNCGGFDGFSINEFDGTVCQGTQKQLTVLVGNNTSSTKKVYLSAENSIVLPSFDKGYVYLNPGEQKPVALNINATNLPLGYQRISLLGDADNFRIEKSLTVNVLDCSDVVKRTLVLSVPSVCFDVRRGQQLGLNLTLTRQSPPGEDCFYQQKTFSLTASGIPTLFSFANVSLMANESRQIPFTVSVPSNESAGQHFIAVTANDGTAVDSFKETKQVCINVLGEQKIGFFVNTQSKDIAIGETQVFEVEAVNSGDLDANYTVSVIGSPKDVSVSLSESSFFLAKGSSKKIFVAVTPGFLAEVKDDQRVVLQLKGPLSTTAFIYFNVKPKSFLDTIQILSASSKIVMKGNSQAEYTMVVKNNSDSDMKNVVISFENVPKDVNIQSSSIGLLRAGKTATISGKITAGDTNGVFTPVFVVASGSAINKKEFTLQIDYNPQGGLAGWFSALFGFGGLTFGSLFVGVILAILLIVFVALIIKAAIAVSKPKDDSKEVWVERT